PMDDWASRGGSLATASVGHTERTPPGRSMGGASLNPKASAGAVIPRALAFSTPIWANAVLHDSWRMGNSVPPQLPPPKLPMGLPNDAAEHSLWTWSLGPS